MTNFIIMRLITKTILQVIRWIVEKVLSIFDSVDCPIKVHKKLLETQKFINSCTKLELTNNLRFFQNLHLIGNEEKNQQCSSLLRKI